ncbi:hypothetical protein SynRCC2555_01871 [Synechococcus sp. WH 8101]|nr:hypothetical protein SynRCC2555_01871 [Synechococcus sp. WH 8101]
MHQEILRNSWQAWNGSSQPGFSARGGVIESDYSVKLTIQITHEAEENKGRREKKIRE